MAMVNYLNLVTDTHKGYAVVQSFLSLGQLILCPF